MFLAKVVGNMVSTVKLKSHRGHKLMIVERIGLDGRPTGARSIAVDAADSGIGDTVLVNDDGSAAQMVFGDGALVCDLTICGVVDGIETGK